MEKFDQSSEFDFSVDVPSVGGVNSKETSEPAPAVSSEPASAPEPAHVKTPAPSAVRVPQIPGDSAPFIVLCGPPASGKSMVLKSLAAYLYHSSNGYSICANTTLLNDALYQENCEDFDRSISDPDHRMDNTVDYLMADIMDKSGNVVAHFLEAPGEDFFSLVNTAQEPNLPFKGYLDKVAQISSKNPRKVIYIMLLDLDSSTSLRKNQSMREKYEKKMIKLYNRYVLHHPSRVILLYNKVDLPHQGLWANSNGVSNIKAIEQDARQNYPNLFFTKKFLFWDIDNFTFLPFCTGSYPEDGSYTASGPVYPSALWEEITKQLW